MSESQNTNMSENQNMVETDHEDILTPEDYALLEKHRRKRSIGDNWFVLGMKTFVLAIIGELLYSILFVILLTILKANHSDLLLPDTSDIFQDIYFKSSILNTAMLYIGCIGIWVFFLFWFFIRKKNRPLIKAITPYTQGNNLKKLVIGLLIGAGMNALCVLLAWLHGDITLTFSCFEILPLLFLLFCILIQSSSEELICRCYYYQRLIKSYKDPKIAIGVTGVYFAALHLLNPGISILSLLNIVVSGVLFALMIYYMDSFWAAAAAHTAWNFTQNIVFGLPNSGQPPYYSIYTLNTDTDRTSFFYSADFGIEGAAMSIVVQLAVIAVICVYYRKRKGTQTDIWAEQQP